MKGGGLFQANKRQMIAFRKGYSQFVSSSFKVLSLVYFTSSTSRKKTCAADPRPDDLAES